MKELIDNISSWTWWFSVVFVGLLINLSSAYLKPRIDTFLAKYSAGRRNKQEKERLADEEVVLALRADKHAQILVAFDEMRQRFRVTTLIIGGLLITTMGVVISAGESSKLIGSILGLCGTLIIFIGQREMNTVIRTHRLLSVAILKNNDNVHSGKQN